jgi:hypothetical protein
MISDITRGVINKCVIEFNKPENREYMVREVLGPMTDFIYDRLYTSFYPYVCYSIVIAMTIIALLVSILVILLRKGN